MPEVLGELAGDPVIWAFVGLKMTKISIKMTTYCNSQLSTFSLNTLFLEIIFSFSYNPSFIKDIHRHIFLPTLTIQTHFSQRKSLLHVFEILQMMCLIMFIKVTSYTTFVIQCSGFKRRKCVHFECTML